MLLFAFYQRRFLLFYCFSKPSMNIIPFTSFLFRRASSSSEESSRSLDSFIKQQSAGLVLETSVERPESTTLSNDSASVSRRSRAESEGQSRMSWTCDPIEAGDISLPALPIPFVSEQRSESPKHLKTRPSNKSATDSPTLAQTNKK